MRAHAGVRLESGNEAPATPARGRPAARSRSDSRLARETYLDRVLGGAVRRTAQRRCRHGPRWPRRPAPRHGRPWTSPRRSTCCWTRSSRSADEYGPAARRSRRAAASCPAAVDLPCRNVLRWLWQGCVVAARMPVGRRERSTLRATASRSPGRSAPSSELPLAAQRLRPRRSACSGDLAARAGGRGEPGRGGGDRHPGSRRTRAMILAACEGQARETRAMIESRVGRPGAGARHRAGGRRTARLPSSTTAWAYDEALAAARSASEFEEVVVENWGLSELVEPAVRSGAHRDLATRAMERLTRRRRATGTDWALGIEARSRAS